jgi:DNA-binding IclR family transcriptional regulator
MSERVGTERKTNPGRGATRRSSRVTRDGTVAPTAAALAGAVDGRPAEAARAAPDYSIAVLDRALDVLEALAEGGEPLGVTALARRVGATKSAAYRILANLERRGFVSKDATTARYALGTRLAYLGQRSLGAFDLRQVARPVLEELHARFHETVNLGVLEGDEVVYIDMIESHHGLRMAARVGARDSVHSTSVGKAMFAFLPPEAIERRLQRPLPRRTPHTIADPARLRRELERVRSRGVAEDHAENELGARCVGAPVFDHAGGVIAAISVSAPESRLDDNRAADVAAAVTAAAAEITKRVGGRAPEPLASAEC